MASRSRVLAVIPARGGSKGLPGKNIRPFAGLPLIGHTIRFAKLCPEITRTIISTDAQAIADVARQQGGDVPFLRPADLAQDKTSLWPVLRHALDFVEKEEGTKYDYVLLLDPTTPCRSPKYVAEALATLEPKAEADGVIGVSQPDFNPIWVSVVEKDGWMTDLFPNAASYTCRQDVPEVYRINGSLYCWRTRFMKNNPDGWRHGKLLMYAIPDAAAISIDTEDEFKRAELFVKSGLFNLPWLEKANAIPS